MATSLQLSIATQIAKVLVANGLTAWRRCGESVPTACQTCGWQRMSPAPLASLAAPCEATLQLCIRIGVRWDGILIKPYGTEAVIQSRKPLEWAIRFPHQVNMQLQSVTEVRAMAPYPSASAHASWRRATAC